MYSENFVKYLLRYQMEEPQESTEKKNTDNKEQLHFGFIYSKMMKHKYAPVTLNVR